MSSCATRVAAALLACAAAASSEARITRLEIVSVQSPTFGGLSFGTVGQYEKIFARAEASAILPATSTDRKLNAIAAGLCKPKGKHDHHDDDDDDDD